LYEFKIMLFGLCNAPATFQRFMEIVLAGLTRNQCFVYLDNILIVYFDCFSFLGRTSWEPPPGVCSSTKCWATTKTKEMHICPTKGLIPRTHNIVARDWSRPRQGWECQRVPCTTKPEDPPTIFGISLVLSSFYSKLFQKLLILYTVSPEDSRIISIIKD